MSGTFDFAPNSRVWEEIAPPEVSATSFRGWEFTSKPAVPYRPTYKITLYGMRWYLNSGGTAFDTTTNPTMNAGRLRAFYIANRTWDNFTFVHETLGSMAMKFAAPVQIPPAMGESGGVIDKFEVLLVPNNPAYV